MHRKQIEEREKIYADQNPIIMNCKIRKLYNSSLNIFSVKFKRCHTVTRITLNWEGTRSYFWFLVAIKTREECPQSLLYWVQHVHFNSILKDGK